MLTYADVSDVHSGADSNIADAEGNTALHTAVMVGRVDMVGYLLAHNADVRMLTHADVC